MANRVAEFRLKHDMTQEELAVRSNVSRTYLSQIETGTQENITNTVMTKIANALDESVADIFFP
jgi:Predicted transcriptional regulators